VSLDTYAGLKASIAAWASYDSLTATIPDFVALAHQEICRLLRAPVLYARADVTVSTESVAVPTGFLAIKRFYLDVSPRVYLTVTSAESAIETTGRSGTGTYPSEVAVEGSYFEFAPLYSTSTTGKLLYYKAPTTLVDDTDTNVVLTKYPALYLYGSLEALFRFKEDDNNADRYGSQFAGMIDSINASEARDAMSGPILGHASGSVV
jgi:hypothetical protein